MNGTREKTVITEQNIEEMCILAEDVMQQLYMRFCDYDAEGNDIFEKYYTPGADFERDIWPLVQKERMPLFAAPESELLYNLFWRGDDIRDVQYYTLEKIRPWVEPLIPKALQLFRKGTSDSGECIYVAAASVPDEFLIAAFAREVRNMMMIIAAQRLDREHPHYLLLLEGDSCHDMDEWEGIYADDKRLKQAYDTLTTRLEKRRETDPSCRGLHVAIWEFWPRAEYYAELTGDYDATLQKISRVDPQNLLCFKNI